MRNLEPGNPLSDLALAHGLTNWTELVDHVRQLPYGRNRNRTNFGLVLTEGKGTCSGKHALLAAIAREQAWADVQLILCLYRMNEDNTPGIAPVLSRARYEYVPEAHCCLEVAGEPLDVTSADSSVARIEKDIMQRREIAPEDVGTFKVNFHEDQLYVFAAQEATSFKEVWELREQCIAQLEKLSTTVDKRKPAIG